MMQNGSCECSKSELDVVSVPPTMTSMQESQWIEHFPVAPLSNYAPIEFNIPPQTEYWTDLSQSYLYVRFKITRSDGTDLHNDDSIAPVNNFLHSMFSSIDLYLNNKLISSNLDTYPYRAYFENLLSYNKDSKLTHLNAGDLWANDTAGEFNALTYNGANEGLKIRFQQITESKKCELLGRLHLDVFQQEKYLPNGIEIRLRLNRAPLNFCLTGADGAVAAKLVLEKVSLNVRNVELLPVVANGLNQSIAQNHMKIPLRRVEVKTFTIGNGLQSKVEDHLFQGQLPKRIFIAMVTNAAFNGAYNQNPFYFGHFNLSKLDVSCNGHSIHNRPFEPDFENNLYLQSYMSMYQTVSALGLNKSFDISKHDYANGYCIWGYDLTPDQGSEGGHLHPIRTGNLRIELQFARSLAQVINVLVFAEFDNQIEINSLREIITDY
jgi:hypothetical protein